MNTAVWRFTVKSVRRSYLGWSIGMAAATAMYAGSFGAVDPEVYTEALEGYPEAFREIFGFDDLATGAGYLSSTVFSIIGPLLMSIFAIGFGNRILARDESAGTLELLVTHPIARRSILWQRAAVGSAGVVGLAGLVALVVMALNEPVGLEVGIGSLVLTCLQLALLGLVFLSLAVAVGGVVGRPAVVLGVTSAVAVLSYLADGLAPVVDSIAWMRWLSVFHYYHGPDAISDGWRPGYAATLVMVIVALLAMATWAFDRRDLSSA